MIERDLEWLEDVVRFGVGDRGLRRPSLRLASPGMYVSTSRLGGAR